MTKKQKAKDLPYRKCVGIVVFNDAGKVFAGHRILAHHDELTGANKLWQMPQGGIDENEEPLQAAYRELFEETGIKNVAFLAKSSGWIHYDLPEDLLGIALKGKYCGQSQKWFAFLFKGAVDEIAINPPPDGHKAEFDAWKWVDLQELPEIVVPFKQQVYQQVVDAFAHIPAEILAKNA